MTVQESRNPSEPERGLAELSASAWLLLAGGLLLVVAGLASGELFALLLSHRLNAELRVAWEQVLSLVARGESGAVAGRFDHIEFLATQRARAMSLHSHTGAYGLLAAAVALAKTRLGNPGRFDLPAAILLLSGAALQSVSYLSFSYGGAHWFSVSSLGVVLLLLGMVLYLPGLLRRGSRAVALPTPDEAGGRLLRIGAVLAFAGLVFGLYLAWRHVFYEEPALHAALRDLIASLQEGKTEAALAQYATYKSTQIRMAITAASHSHAVAFAFVMIITALAAPHLGLSRGWWKVAAVLIGTGGLLLPVFVYLAPRYGYAFALCADSAGGLVILGLLVVLAGLIRGRGGPP